MCLFIFGKEAIPMAFGLVGVPVVDGDGTIDGNEYR